MRYAAIGGVFSGRLNLTWPLATLEIHGDRVRIAPRVLLQRGALGLPPVEIPLSALTNVETDFVFRRRESDSEQMDQATGRCFGRVAGREQRSSPRFGRQGSAAETRVKSA